MIDDSYMMTLALECGAHEAGFVDMGSLTFSEDIRAICETNVCRNYGACWACPPAVGSLAECVERVGRYDRMLLFSGLYELEDSFDFEGMASAMRDFEEIPDALERRAGELMPDSGQYLILSNEGCGRCRKCAYPDSPCRFPDMLHHSIEGYGFNVAELAGLAGMRYNNGPCTVTYFGALLYRSADGSSA